jgi:hypothetical protein
MDGRADKTPGIWYKGSIKDFKILSAIQQLMSQTTTHDHARTIHTNIYAEIIQGGKTMKDKVYIIHL